MMTFVNQIYTPSVAAHELNCVCECARARFIYILTTVSYYSVHVYNKVNTYLHESETNMLITTVLKALMMVAVVFAAVVVVMVVVVLIFFSLQS